MITAIDFETYYDADYSVGGSHPYTYCHDDRFDPYLVSLTREDGAEWVGRPEDCPGWDDLAGGDFIAHNAAFDLEVFLRCQELGLIPKHIKVANWYCTADLGRYFQLARSLAGACFGAFGRKRSKQIRDVEMKGKHWEDIVQAGLAKQVLEYALDDTRDCIELWENYAPRWPEHERRLSNLSRNMGRRGPAVNVPLLKDGIAALERESFNATQNLPWTDEYDAKYKKNYPPQSKRGLALTCQKHGITPPESTAKDSQEYAQWEEKHGKVFPWVKAMSTKRQADKHLATLRSIERRLRPDGTIPYGLKYAGADTTLRFSGDTGFNTQNMPRDAILGVMIRHLFIPRPGHVFVICDLSQIEPRCLAWGSGDIHTLEKLAAGVSPYEVHARASMGYTGKHALKKTDPQMYSLAKARVLSLGYGASWLTFIGQARTYGATHIFEQDITPDNKQDFLEYVGKYGTPDTRLMVSSYDQDELQTAVNAWIQVMDYRATNPLVTGFWYDNQNSLVEACHQRNGSELNFELPSGRVMRYLRLRRDDRSITGLTQYPDTPSYNKRRNLYGAMLTENFCQGMGRDVFGEHLIELADVRKYMPVFQIHDEVVIEVPLADADDVKEEVEAVMSRTPDWAEGLPVAAEAKITDKFEK